MTKILAIDPGVTTGLALYLKNEKNGSEDLLTYTETDVEKIYLLLKGHRWDEVIYENYSGTTISKYGLHTVRLIGSIIGICWALGWPCASHEPQYRLQRIKLARWYLENKNFGTKVPEHEIDALAHLLVYIDEHDWVTNVERFTKELGQRR